MTTGVLMTCISIKHAVVALLGFLATGAISPADAAAPTVDPFLSAVRVADNSSMATVGDLRFDGQSISPVVQTNAYMPTGYPEESYQVPPVDSEGWGYGTPGGCWGWEVLPGGIIYRSYQAGPRESRLALHAIQNSYPGQRSETAWDATLGGRRALLRYGNGDATNPVGWQIDMEGATIVRLNLDEDRDVDSSDFRFGVPISYTSGNGVSYKLGYYHLSSHLGDELIARTGTNTRINYVRDAIIAGISYQATPSLRVYGETAFAFFTAGGAEPWEFQVGAEWSKPGATGFAGTPFLATNAHLREETDFGGDWTLQTGWLWRGDTGSTTRLGLHYMNGKSTQYQFFNRNEEQIGLGIWYDF